MRRTTTVVDATETEHREPALPSVVSALESSGFRVIGRIAVRAAPSRDDHVYAAGERKRLAVWRARPAATLLVAQDGTSYASVDTFGDAPAVRLRTELTDRSLVETVGIAPAGVLVPRDGTDPLAGIMLSSAPGRSVRLLPTADPAAVLDSHVGHVGEVAYQRGAGAAGHHGRPEALALWLRASEHHEACARWFARRCRRQRLRLAALAWAFTMVTWFAIRSVVEVGSTILNMALAVAILLSFAPLLRLAARRRPHRLVLDASARPRYPLPRHPVG